MNYLSDEFKLIERSISNIGYRVTDCIYHRELILSNVSGADFYVGANVGAVAQHSFFYGNVNIWSMIHPPVVLANRNMNRFNFTTFLYGGAEFTDLDVVMGVNLGMSLMGDGHYIGNKRLYGCGFNHIWTWEDDFGVGTTFEVQIGLGGFLFNII